MKRLQEFSRNELTAKDREISELKVIFGSFLAIFKVFFEILYCAGYSSERFSVSLVF